MNMKDVMFYLKKNMGKFDEKRREKNSYLFRQIVEYKEEDFFNHIQKHSADYNKDLDNPNKNIFVPGFPIENVVNEVKKNLFDNNRLYTGFIENTYVFKCEGCGRVDKKLVDYLKVVCFDKTKDIITMLPVSGMENFPQVDISYITKKEEKKEEKRPSQIDKFNKRFKRN